jgi:hypothetical protein
MPSDEVYDGLADRIWPDLQPALQEIATAVRGAVPTVHCYIGKWRNASAPFFGYVSVVTADNPAIADEDVVISVNCWAGGAYPNDVIKCGSDIMIQGPQGYLLDGPQSDIQIGEGTDEVFRAISEWVIAVKTFLSENRELIVREVIAARRRGSTYS